MIIIKPFKLNCGTLAIEIYVNGEYWVMTQNNLFYLCLYPWSLWI